jgi:hypothetical protein
MYDIGKQKILNRMAAIVSITCIAYLNFATFTKIFTCSHYTEFFKKKYTLSKIYFTQTEVRTLKVIFTSYKHLM